VARPLIFIILLITLQIQALHGATGTHRAKLIARLKRQCEEEGSGKACYDYSGALMARGGTANHKLANLALARGCELKYKPACDVRDRRSITTRRAKRLSEDQEGTGSICFSNKEESTARLTPNPMGKNGVMGQKIDMIQPNSFWDKVGLKENDVVVRVNNMPFNNIKEAVKAFGSAGKKFGFEVRRGDDTLTLFYSCL
jgi:hypothetical protein